jgi:hypothetical protein
MYTGEDIASGLRRLADMFEGAPHLASRARRPSVPQRITVGVNFRSDVEAAASVLGGTVREDDNGDHVFVSTEGDLDGLTVSVYAVVDAVRPLRRDPGVTAALAERDA